MSKYAFRWTVAILVTIMLSLLSVIGKQSPEALANRAPPLDRARLTAEMLDKVNRRADRMYELCSYLGRVAVQFRLEEKMSPAICEKMRAEQNLAIARINKVARDGTDNDLRALSSSVDQLMTETAPHMQTMEESYATVSRIMREAGRK
jgi:folate-binding Fe-S cluster repair protein YgfZ